MTEQPRLEGYGMTATLAEGVLTVVARNLAVRGALGTPERSIRIEEITAVEYVAPTLLKNGSVVVESPIGTTVIHFTRKHAEAAQSLHQSLLDHSCAAADALVTAPLANEGLDAFDARAAKRRAAVARRLAENEARHKEARARARADFEAARAAEEDARVAMKAAWREVIHSTTSERVAELAALLDEAEAPREFDVGAEVAAVEVEVAADGRARTAIELAKFALEEAEAAADAGEVAREEEMILTARAVARIRADRADRKEIEAQLAQRIGGGKLRRGARLLGTVRSEHGLDSWLRTRALPAGGSGEKWIEIWSDRVVTADAAYPISAQTSAQVYVDGEEFITQRPTLTRMALFAPLPGSALIPGLAFQKKETTDHRSAELQIRDANWALRAAIPPGALSTPRQLAEQVNATAAGLARRTAQQQSGATDLLTQLERLSLLIDNGVISEEEAHAIKATMLTGGA